MAIDNVTFWLNAFIPNSVCTQRGDTFVLDIPSLVPNTPVPTVRFFAGDQREFSDDNAASARMHSEVRLEGLSGDHPVIASQKQRCGASAEINEDGSVGQTATAGNDRMQFTNLRGSQTTDPEGGVVDGIPDSVQVDLFGSANLPLLAFAPDIDYSGTLTIDRDEGNILFKGAISGFPAFELYYQVNDGAVQTLGQFSPVSPLDLIGDENRPVDLSSRVQL